MITKFELLTLSFEWTTSMFMFFMTNNDILWQSSRLSSSNLIFTNAIFTTITTDKKTKFFFEVLFILLINSLILN